MTIFGEGNGTPLQYSCQENPMDGGAWSGQSMGSLAKSRTRLRDFTFSFYFHALEKEMATHSSILAWRIPGMGEPGGLPSMGLHSVGHDWSDLAAAAAAAAMTILPYIICDCKMGFVSNRLKAFKLQKVVQAPTSATASSNYYLGPLDQRPSIWGLGEYVASTRPSIAGSS